MSLDFLDSVMDAIENNVDLKDMKLRTAILKPESIALLLTPNGEKIGYQDGSYERSFSFNLNGSSKQEMKVLNVLNAITAYFDNTEIESIQSLNNSFVLEDKETTSVPNIVSASDDGTFIYSASFKIKLYIESEEK
ncbi:TPA: minor capsid protein [Listeria monocytogenes]|uniref:minor capsid protein n=1 Tax=Listeria monocytogenes TaxID=1639 RepID=UPI0008750D1A|nr:minor capsid protein [Listeria monocytogenes]EAE3767791.1 minor capsid protein [Listeria monocytogenes serotype 1/2b]EHC6163393.1 minor capsid protein [Listeria monocytogenes serotype 1/2a]EAC4897254.1 minor capsid protein [Listeria monocytogenes]EAC4924966.1 minor capsid protein [Listeria monocytogenes]EAC5167493.1 minor capsid protein [Listeria monocytogenes]